MRATTWEAGDRRARHSRSASPLRACVAELRAAVEGARPTWYCACRARVSSVELTPGIVQEGYLVAVPTFNANIRQCPACECVHPAVGDIDPAAAAAAVRASPEGAT